MVAIILALSRTASAEPLHLLTPSTVTTDGGTTLRLPPGYFLEERVWNETDAEMRRLQDRETRLDAENKSLRRSANSVSFGWYALGTAVVAGFVAGYYFK